MTRPFGIVTRVIEENVRDILADTVVMVRPKAFGFNPETAATNAFQKSPENKGEGEIQAAALEEFEALKAALEGAGIKVLAFDDRETPKTPDAVFPNNWFCTLPGGQMFTFPMAAPVRRQERRIDILNELSRGYGLNLNRSLEVFEGQGKALEGTGSLVLDHGNKLAYAALSGRTDKDALLAFEAASGYLVVAFTAFGPDNKPIYHTNVMMTLGPGFAIIGADTLAGKDKSYVLGVLERSGKTILKLSNTQVFDHFAGNMLSLRGKDGDRVLVMSKAAEKSLTNAQRAQIMGAFGCKIVAAAIPTIERLGGGSARCMLAEVF